MGLAYPAKQFDIAGKLVTINAHGSGNVNDTFLGVFRTTFSEERVIIQRINTHVFSNPEWIMSNMRVVTEHAHAKLESESDDADRVWQLPRVIPCRDGKDYFIDDEGDYWRAITLMASAKSYERIVSAEHAFEAGTVLGQFHRLISDIDTSLLHDTLPGFHKAPTYLAAYEDELKTEQAAQVLSHSVEARRMRTFVEERRDLVDVLEDALESGRLTTRPIHGDPKVANIMIDELTGHGTSIVDLDTVKPGLVHYDFGDALRSVCNRAGEETTNLNEVYFDIDLCEAFAKGYMKHAKEFLSHEDRELLFEAVRLLSLELGLRFFQDSLAGDVYFKVRYSGQNLNRARVQFKLCESIEAREKPIRDVFRMVS